MEGNFRQGPQVCAMGLLVNFDSFFLKVTLMASKTKISAPVRKHNKCFSIIVSSDLIYFLKYCSSNVYEVIRAVLNSLFYFFVFFIKRFCTHQKHQKHKSTKTQLSKSTKRYKQTKIKKCA